MKGHSHVKWLVLAECKNLETMSGKNLNGSQPKSSVKRVANEKLCRKAIGWASFQFPFKYFSLKSSLEHLYPQ